MSGHIYLSDDWAPDRRSWEPVPDEPIEKIQCAAIRWFNDIGGECVVWGTRKDLSNAHHLIRNDLMILNPVHGSDLFKSAEQGFLTTEERFVKRGEALLIAVQQDQIFHKHPDYNILYSEDLRPCMANEHTWCFNYQENS